ncbi:MAG: ABC transporter permease [Acidimicrobiales bacterium]
MTAILPGRWSVFVGFGGLVACLTVSEKSFATTANLLNLLQQNALMGIVALGMLVMMVSGGFDLSVGAVGASANVTAAYALRELGVIAAIGATVLVGATAGLVNGLLITKVNISPFITTLGTATVISGLLYVVTEATPVYDVPDYFAVIGNGRTASIPNGFLIMLAVAVVLGLVLEFTGFGRHLYATGSDHQAADLLGVATDRVLIKAYMIGGLCAALGGLLLLGQTGIGQPSAADSWPLLAIAACVLGGATLSGGVGTVAGTLLGVAVLGVLSNGLNLIGVSPFWKPAASGMILISAVAVDSFRQGRRV